MGVFGLTWMLTDIGFWHFIWICSKRLASDNTDWWNVVFIVFPLPYFAHDKFVFTMGWSIIYGHKSIGFRNTIIPLIAQQNVLDFNSICLKGKTVNLSYVVGEMYFYFNNRYGQFNFLSALCIFDVVLEGISSSVKMKIAYMSTARGILGVLSMCVIY